MLHKKYLLVTTVLAFASFLLTACGDYDKGNAVTPSPEPTTSAPAAASPAESSGGFDVSSIEKAEGVVYMDEIYANWPYSE